LQKKAFQVLKCTFSQQICIFFALPIEIIPTFANVNGKVPSAVSIPEDNDNRNELIQSLSKKISLDKHTSLLHPPGLIAQINPVFSSLKTPEKAVIYGIIPTMKFFLEKIA